MLPLSTCGRSTQELTAAVVNCAAQTSLRFQREVGGAPLAPPLTEKQLTVDKLWGRESSFFFPMHQEMTLQLCTLQALLDSVD